MIAVLGGGVAGAALAWALTVHGRRDVVVFDPLPMGAGSTGRPSERWSRARRRSSSAAPALVAR